MYGGASYQSQHSGSFYSDYCRPIIMRILRIRLKFLLKSLVVIISLILLLPILIGHIDSKEKRKSLENEKALRLKFNDSNSVTDVTMVTGDLESATRSMLTTQQHHQHNQSSMTKKEMPKDTDFADQDDHRPVVARGREHRNVHKMEQGGESVKTYGPRAVFKRNVKGNFEPEDVPIGSAPGEGGRAVRISESERGAADQSIREFGFNMVASDKIAMVRNIPDTRLDECKYWHYPEELPTASVIIVFHNEGWSTLMRTVHSVIATSPKHLLKEVVMVDDFSDKVHLKDKLDQYIKQFNGLVNLYRNKERLGLIQTRTNGAKYAKGDVIVFLDAHCECQKNWLVPLLSRVAYDRTIMAVPIIDGIDWNDFHYSPVYEAHRHFRGIFEWGFLYKESAVPAQELRRRGSQNSAPYRSPTHAGGLFAMDRNYFFELGGYDPGLQIWGGENFELSFKIWQCGGSIEWVPCSRVGHVYRNSMPYGFGKISPKIPVILHNYMRVVEVWLDDEFKEYFYAREPTIRGYDIGDVSKQLEFKKTHKCKSFKWYMENIAYEVYEKFPPPSQNVAWGEIKTKHANRCWDTMGQQVGGNAIGITPCHHWGGNQLFRLNKGGQMGVGERCIQELGTNHISLQYCPVQPTGPWELRQDGSIYHKTLRKCAEAGSATKLLLSTCEAGNESQQWEINKIKTW